MPADQTERNLKNLHAASMTLIETTGVRLHHADMLEIVRANGIRVANGRVGMDGCCIIPMFESFCF